MQAQVIMKFQLGSGIVLGRAVTTSPNTGLEVSVPGRPDVFLSPEPQGTLILPVRSADLNVAPLAAVFLYFSELMPHWNIVMFCSGGNHADRRNHDDLDRGKQS